MASYSVAMTASATAAGYIAYLRGSATKTIKVNRVILNVGASSTRTTLSRISTPDTGTQIPQSPAAHDTTSVVATATAFQIGTPVGNAVVVSNFTNIEEASLNPIIINYGDHNDNSIVLRGTGDYLAVQYSAAGAISITFEWTEDNT